MQRRNDSAARGARVGGGQATNGGVYGGERSLGVPTLRDRVVQMAAKLVLEPLFEADF